jgi:hypothetical protein
MYSVQILAGLPTSKSGGFSWFSAVLSNEFYGSVFSGLGHLFFEALPTHLPILFEAV